MKYIVFRVHGKLCMDIPVVFPALLVHSSVAEALIPLLREAFSAESTPISAGEVSLFDVDECHGQSTTLHLKSRGDDDTQLLRMNDYGVGLCVGDGDGI